MSAPARTTDAKGLTMIEDNDLISAMIESGQGAITGRSRTWLNSQVAQALTTAQAEAEALRKEVEALRGALNTYDDPMSCLTSAERGEGLADAVRTYLSTGENT